MVGLLAHHYRGPADLLEIKALDLQSVLTQAQAMLAPRQVAELRNIAEAVARMEGNYPQVRVGE